VPPNSGRRLGVLARSGEGRQEAEVSEGAEVKRKRDQLLDEPLLSAKELESWVTDLKGMQTGESPNIVGSYDWERAKTEMVRRQVNAQIRAANALVSWTVALAVFTAALVTVSVIQLWVRCRP
jgi:hypothetical protein